MTWVLTAESIHQVVPLIGISLTVAIILFITIMITRKITKDAYEHILEKRINEVANNIIEKYNGKILEVEDLREKLKNEKVYKKQALKMLTEILGKLNE